MVQKFKQKVFFEAQTVQKGTPTANGWSGRPQIICDRNGTAQATRQGTAGSRTDLNMITRMRHRTCGVPVKDIQIGYAGYVMTASGEAALGTDHTIEVGLELTTPVVTTIQAYFGGAKLGTIANGIAVRFSDVIGADFAPDTDFFTRHIHTLGADTEFFPLGGASGGVISGESGWIYASGSSQAQSTGALTDPGSGASLGGVAPIAIIGTPLTPVAALLAVGDSIFFGNNDTASTTTGAITMWERACENVNGHRMPWMQQSVGSTALLNRRLDSSPRGRALWKYCTAAIQQMCTNDVSSQTVAQMQANMTELWTALSRTVSPYGRPLDLAQVLMLPRTTSNKKLKANPTIANGGSTYANSSTFDVTIAGGTLKAGESATTISVTTNSSGVITTINGITNNGIYTTAPSTPNSATGGAGSGLSLTCVFGGWFDAANQTPNTGYEVGGKRDQLNAWIISQVGQGLVDASIDTSTNCLEDPLNHGLWISNGTVNFATSDGTHPEPAGHLLGAPPINVWLSTLKAI